MKLILCFLTIITLTLSSTAFSQKPAATGKNAVPPGLAVSQAARAKSDSTGGPSIPEPSVGQDSGGQSAGDAGSDTACKACDGQVTSLVFRNMGGDSYVDIRLHRSGTVAYSDVVPAGAEFTISGAETPWNHNLTLGPTIFIAIDGIIRELHTSCSVEIGPGTVVGQLLVTSASSRNGGLMCPLPGYEPPQDEEEEPPPPPVIIIAN